MIRNAKIKLNPENSAGRGKGRVGLAGKSDCLDVNLNENETSIPPGGGHLGI